MTGYIHINKLTDNISVECSYKCVQKYNFDKVKVNWSTVSCDISSIWEYLKAVSLLKSIVYKVTSKYTRHYIVTESASNYWIIRSYWGKNPTTLTITSIEAWPYTPVPCAVKQLSNKLPRWIIWVIDCHYIWSNTTVIC